MSLQSDWFAFDIMSEVIFGMKYEALKKSTYRHVTQAIQDSNIRVSTLVQAYSLTTGRVDRYIFPASILARNAFLKFITSLLRDRSKTPPSQDNGDVFSFLETAKDPDNEKTLTKSEIRAECATLVVAGSDTSSSTLAATLFYLSENQEPYKRVYWEIRQKFASLDEIKLGAQLNSCTYLRACIDEALRMSPPVGGALWREVGPGGITIGSTHLPQGVDVGTGIYSLHHNTSYFHEPFRFNPERWLDGENGVTKEQVELARSAFHPFSSGPRGCIGKGFAYHEMTLTLSHILYQFDFYRAEHPTIGAGQRPVIQGHVQFLLKDHITGAKEGPELLFRLR
ncbi:pisatin demethylase [Lizonia empirigonia]|nr:pisatin demethylase [Lizonia empirigonia]